MLVRCRECSGYTRVELGGKLLGRCQPFVEGEKEAHNVTTNPETGRRASPGREG